MTETFLKDKFSKLRANVDKNPYEDIPEIIFSGNDWHVADDYHTVDTKRMVVHIFRLISEKNYEGIKDLFTALTTATVNDMKWYGRPIETNTREFYNSTYEQLKHGYPGNAKMMGFWDKERIISLLKKKYSIVGNVTTPAEFAASLLMNESTKSPEDIAKLWSILFYLSNDEITKTDYMQDFIRKAENIKSFDDDVKEAAHIYKNKYFKEGVSKKVNSVKERVSEKVNSLKEGVSEKVNSLKEE
jgi:hypothetical protein